MSSYKISRRIGRGGMAEVFLGMREGLGGFENFVVIKRIFKQYGEDERFINMFLDEARLAASIRHPNVVQIQDIGKDAEGYYIVMEYLSGESLAYVFQKLRAQQVTIPAPIVARICADIAAGLHYAHTATDPLGQPLNIVHRDVTPSNILVCFNGTAKILDFGIAKAQVRDSHTRTGALKGKMSYLSPEQIEDHEIDARTDVFQLGICLHELMTGARLFHAQGDHKKMLAVMERKIPRPSEANPYVPPVFDDVVMRALERDVERRTPTADQLRRDLEYALAELGATVSDHDVADWMQSTFSKRHKERVAMERESVAHMRSGRPSADDLPVVGAPITKTPTMAAQKMSTQAATSNRLPLTLIAGGSLVGIALGVLFYWRSVQSAPEPPVVTEPASAGKPAAAAEEPKPTPPEETVAAAETPDAGVEADAAAEIEEPAATKVTPPKESRKSARRSGQGSSRDRDRKPRREDKGKSSSDKTSTTSTSGKGDVESGAKSTTGNNTQNGGDNLDPWKTDTSENVDPWKD